MKVGDKVRNINTGETGIILNIWDGKYTVDYYEGEQYNPYRIMVELNHSVNESPDEYISYFKAEHLEKI